MEGKIILAVHAIFLQYMKEDEADEVTASIANVMEDERDGPEFVRLMQQWLARGQVR